MCVTVSATTHLRKLYMKVYIVFGFCSLETRSGIIYSSMVFSSCTKDKMVIFANGKRTFCFHILLDKSLLVFILSKNSKYRVKSFLSNIYEI